MNFRIIILLLLLNTHAIAVPKIVASIQPIFDIATALTQGVTTPVLLLKKQQSPHHFHLKPSQRILLAQADLTLYVHTDFETALAKLLKQIPADKQLSLNTAQHNHHTWLSIGKMQAFSKKITQKLIKLDSNNKTIYQKNLRELSEKLTQLKHEVQTKLKPYAKQEVASFSKAFAHFLQENSLKNTTVVNKSHEARLSIFKILNAKKSIKKTQTKCLIATTETSKNHLRTLSEGLNIKTAQLDIRIKPYFSIMQNIAVRIAQCLK
jgi:zinc transport system substrate-binding protein